MVVYFEITNLKGIQEYICFIPKQLYLIQFLKINKPRRLLSLEESLL